MVGKLEVYSFRSEEALPDAEEMPIVGKDLLLSPIFVTSFAIQGLIELLRRIRYVCKNSLDCKQKRRVIF